MNGFVLDTNVVSELERDRPTPVVDGWFSGQPEDGLFVTTVTIGEIGAGVEVLAPGRRRARLQAWLDDLVRYRFAGRVLPYDTEAALIFGRLIARARDAGRPSGIADAQIAAIASARGLAVATRDVRDFSAFGIDLANPWDGPAQRA